MRRTVLLQSSRRMAGKKPPKCCIHVSGFSQRKFPNCRAILRMTGHPG